MSGKYSRAVKEEALRLAREGKIDTEISSILGVSTTTLRNWRRKNNVPASDGDKKRLYSVDQINEVIDLIREEVWIGQIQTQTGVNRRKIREIHNEERKGGNPLPDLIRGIAIRSKYSDEELIELAYQNPGYGFKRFVSFLSISEKHCLQLFFEFKNFTNDEEDLYQHLQDESYGTMVTREDYQNITGKKYSPKGSGLSSSRAPGTRKGVNLKQIFLPPQIFNWGEISEKIYKNTAHDAPLDWIKKRISEKGYLTSQEDCDEFVSATGAGATKFNKWMKRANLVFNKKTGMWTEIE
jgi:DNA-binding transcriptional MerR regulator